jgi:hypothetical protein
LTARVVQYLKQIRETETPDGRGFLLLYFFFKHAQPDNRTFTAMLLSLLSQVVFQDAVVLDLIYRRCMQVDLQTVRSPSLLRELAELALETQSTYFIVLDALDECIEVPGEDTDNAQREVIDWLESLGRRSTVRHGREVGAEGKESCVRLLVSGQKNGLLEERLRHWPMVQLNHSGLHVSDIKAYTEAGTLQLQRKFGIKDDVRLDLVSRLTSRAKGGFQH